MFHVPWEAFFNGPRSAADELSTTFGGCASFILIGIAHTIHGLTQIATAPVAWLRALGRGFYAVVNGWQDFRENAGVKRLVKEAEEAKDNTKKHDIAAALVKKLKKAKGWQPTASIVISQLKDISKCNCDNDERSYCPNNADSISRCHLVALTPDFFKPFKPVPPSASKDPAETAQASNIIS